MLIYRATNKINSKVYIGQTIQSSLNKRIYQHYRKVKLGINYLFVNALRKYKREDWEWDVIDEADNLEDLNRLEIFWINFYHSTNKRFGYNLYVGGDNNYCKKGQKPWNKGKKDIIPWNKGKKGLQTCSNSTRNKMRKNSPRNKRVYVILNNEVKYSFISLRETSRSLNISTWAISKSIKEKRPIKKGPLKNYIFNYGTITV